MRKNVTKVPWYCHRVCIRDRNGHWAILETGWHDDAKKLYPLCLNHCKVKHSSLLLLPSCHQNRRHSYSTGQLNEQILLRWGRLSNEFASSSKKLLVRKVPRFRCMAYHRLPNIQTSLKILLREFETACDRTCWKVWVQLLWWESAKYAFGCQKLQLCCRTFSS